MLVVIPEVEAFATVEQSLSQSFVDDVVLGLSVGDFVDLHLPKFRIESSFSVKQALLTLGMTDPFSPGLADFSGIIDFPTFISNVIHKSFVSVDEKGTEAAAATAVIITDTGMPEVTTLTVDRPFFFFIRDNATGAVLFFGRVLDPSA